MRRASRRSPDHARIELETPDGPYALEADWLVACDGSRSAVRQLMGLSFEGRVFEDRFLIADIKMPADFPAERWFWFDPPFNPGQSALLHKQPDDIWRIDLQLGWDADPVEERKPERVRPRLEAMLGKDRPFEFEWISIYTFQCRRLERFVHGPVIFAGDAAHLVSPFGARGFNSGVQDIDNLAWKLAAVLEGQAPRALLATYGIEREAAADENILNSTRSTDFITPKSRASRTIRDAALSLTAEVPFARTLVNSGRLSTPTVYDTPLSTPDTEPFGGTARLARPLPDAPLRRADGSPAWLLDLLGPRFTLLYCGDELPCALPAHVALVRIGQRRSPTRGPVPAALRRRPGSAWLVRPDQHLCARFRRVEPQALEAAVERALGWGLRHERSLILSPNLHDADGFYAAFVDGAPGPVRRGQRAAQRPPGPDPGQPHRRPADPARGPQSGPRAAFRPVTANQQHNRGTLIMQRNLWRGLGIMALALRR